MVWYRHYVCCSRYSIIKKINGDGLMYSWSWRCKEPNVKILIARQIVLHTKQQSNHLQSVDICSARCGSIFPSHYKWQFICCFSILHSSPKTINYGTMCVWQTAMNRIVRWVWEIFRRQFSLETILFSFGAENGRTNIIDLLMSPSKKVL